MSKAQSIILLSLICMVIAMSIELAGCAPPAATPTPAPVTGVTGNAANGQVIVNSRCVGCHRTNGTAAPLTAANGNLLTNNLATLSVAMAGLTLTDQEVADVKAFLATQ